MTTVESSLRLRLESAGRAPSLPRLTLVELRKFLDTRAGLWLLVAIGLVSAAVIVVTLIWTPDEDQFLGGYFADSILVLSLLLPVLGILLVTGEWNHRAALTTFALVPKRGRVSVAKIAAGGAAGLGATVVSLGLASAATGVAAISGGADWSIRWSHVASAALLLVLSVLMGIAFGMALLNSALAIVVYFFLPTIWAVLGSAIPALRTAAEWLDTGQTMPALFAPDVTAGSWARLAASVAVWVALPLAIGLLRVGRREVS